MSADPTIKLCVISPPHRIAKGWCAASVCLALLYVPRPVYSQMLVGRYASRQSEDLTRGF